MKKLILLSLISLSCYGQDKLKGLNGVTMSFPHSIFSSSICPVQTNSISSTIEGKIKNELDTLLIDQDIYRKMKHKTLYDDLNFLSTQREIDLLNKILGK